MKGKGSELFQKKIKESISFRALSDDIIEKSQFKPTIEQIITTVSEVFNVEINTIEKSTPGTCNYPRKISMFIAQKHFRYSLSEIAYYFNLSRYQSVSNVIRPLKKEIANCSNLSTLLRDVLSKLEQKLTSDKMT